MSRANEFSIFGVDFQEVDASMFHADAIFVCSHEYCGEKKRYRVHTTHHSCHLYEDVGVNGGEDWKVLHSGGAGDEIFRAKVMEILPDQGWQNYVRFDTIVRAMAEARRPLKDTIHENERQIRKLTRKLEESQVQEESKS